MNFAIENGMPYLISNGKAYPVDIKDGVVTYDTKTASMTNSEGGYSLDEVVAKCGKNVSSIKKTTKKSEV